MVKPQSQERGELPMVKRRKKDTSQKKKKKKKKRYKEPEKP